MVFPSVWVTVRQKDSERAGFAGGAEGQALVWYFVAPDQCNCCWYAPYGQDGAMFLPQTMRIAIQVDIAIDSRLDAPSPYLVLDEIRRRRGCEISVNRLLVKGSQAKPFPCARDLLSD
jgi:hypothetical protein